MAKYTPLQEKAYQYLKEKINRGELEHGKFYSETKMAAEIGISRTPFKDALVRLSQDRYIDIVPSRGFCLHALSLQDITNTYQSRTAVEGFCALTLHTRRNENCLAMNEKSIRNQIRQFSLRTIATRKERFASFVAPDKGCARTA